MRYVVLMAAFLCLSVNGDATSPAMPDECDIEALMEEVDVPVGTMATDGFDAIEVEQLLTPTTIETGKYEIEVTEEYDDLYEVSGYNLFVQTQYCYYGSSLSDDAILDVSSRNGVTVGKLIFLE